MTHHDDFAPGAADEYAPDSPPAPDHPEYGRAPGAPGGGSHRGGAEVAPARPRGQDAGHGGGTHRAHRGDAEVAPGYPQAPPVGPPAREYGYGQTYDTGYPQGPDQQTGYAYGDPYGGTYAPGPAGYGGPSAAEAWGHPGTPEPYPYPHPAAAQPWAAPADHPYEGQPSQPSPYAEPQGYEHTAVLPVVEEARLELEPALEAEPESLPGLPEALAPAPRTGSPIVPPGFEPAALTAVLGLLLGGGAALGKVGLAVALVLLQGVTAAGWFRLNGMWPARQGIVLAFLGGVTADVALLVADGAHGPAVLLGTLGVWLLLVLVLQLRHHGSADERLSSLTATSASTFLTVLAAGFLATATTHAGHDPVVVGVCAVGAATLARSARLPGGLSVTLALLVAAASGFGTGRATGLGAFDGVLLALACGLCALIGLRVASYDFPSRFVHFTAGVALPLTAAAPAVYILGTALS